MSYAAPADPGERRRPPVVTAAGYLLYVSAALALINGLLPLSSISKVANAAREAYAGSTNPTPEAMATVIRVSVIAFAVVGVIAAILYVVLGSLDLRGNRVGRIITWVIAGLGVLCSICLSAGGIGGVQVGSGTTPSGVDVKAANDHINAARPSWLTPTTLTLGLLSLLTLILVIILLALPASNAYFRSPGAAGHYPTGDPNYPNLAYPPVPGAPSPGMPPYPPPAAPPAPPRDEPPA